MGRDILTRVYLEFERENRQEILSLLKKSFKDNFKIIEKEEEFLNVEFWNIDLEEEDFEGFKKLCTYISKGEYEALDEGSFMWEKEEI